MDIILVLTNARQKFAAVWTQLIYIEDYNMIDDRSLLAKPYCPSCFHFLVS